VLFARGVGEDTDIVTKEMYSFTDRDGTSLTLRPECTASVIRSYIEHRLDQSPGVKKYYYLGPMFRRERPPRRAATGSFTRSAPNASAQIRRSSTPRLSRWRFSCSGSSAWPT